MSTQEKDITRFNQVYDENVNKVFRTAMCYVNRNTHLAEEITQNVFMKLYSYSDAYDEVYLSKWLLTVTKNEALNCIKKVNREVPESEITVLVDLHTAEECVEEHIMGNYEKAERIQVGRSILEELYAINSRWYDAITLVYCMGKKQQDVAEEMGIDLTVLHSMLYRAKKWIKKRYQEEAYRKRN